MGSINRSYVILASAAVLVIIFSNVIIAELQYKKPQESAFKILSYGPLWNGITWSCNSDKDFVVFGALRSPLNDTQLAIAISGGGQQSLYALDQGKLQSLTVGSTANHMINITRTGVITGWVTLQTSPDANASCTQS